jgi:hypothetical protein
VGLPSQQNFSMSQRTQNIEAFNLDGTSNTYTVIASDRLSNPVPADTAINFIAEGGQVQAIRFTTLTNGLASATANFQSSSPRPDDGRVTVLAYALGEESFLDTNGDNVYSAGEDYQDLGDVFLDRLFNRSFNVAQDQFISLAITGTDACRNADADALLGLRVDSPTRTLSVTGAAINTCVAGWGRAYVRKALQTVFSTSTARLGWRGAPGPLVASTPGNVCARTTLIDQISTSPYGVNDSISTVPFYLLGDAANVVLSNAGKTGAFAFLVADTNPVALNPVAAGSVITATATTGLTVTVLGSPVPNTLDPSSASVAYEFNDTTNAGTITISVRSPGGLTTAYTQTINRLPVAGAAPCP